MKKQCAYEACQRWLRTEYTFQIGYCREHNPNQKICATEGCNNVLRSHNATGYCQKNPQCSTKRITVYLKANPDKNTNKNRRPVLTRRPCAEFGCPNRINKTNQHGYCKKHKPFSNGALQKRRAKKKALFVEHVDLQIVWERDNGICHICELPADINDWHLDHIIPSSRGGMHEYANVAVSHPWCNRSKADKTLDEYKEKHGTTINSRNW